MIKRALLLMTVVAFVAAPLASAAEKSCCCEASGPSRDACEHPCAIEGSVPTAAAIVPAPAPMASQDVPVANTSVAAYDFSPAELQPPRDRSPSLHAPPLRRYLLACIFRL